MPGKQRYIRSIDIPLTGAFDAGADPNGTAAIAPPVQPSIGAPTNLALTTANERNASTPTSNIGATWYPPPGTAPSSYVVQWSTNSAFPDPGTNGQGATATATTISGLIPATVYYVRVAAIVANLVSDWSAVVSITTQADVVPPDPVTALASSFQGSGDLVVTWVNPSSANLKDVVVSIYTGPSGTLLATLYNTTQRLTWTAAQNLAATGGAGDASLWIDVQARSWGNTLSTIVNTSASKAAPTAPTISVDFTGADAVYTITAPSDAARLSFVADTSVTARVLPISSRYTYSFDQNRVDHSGTADPSLAYSFTAVDGLGQASTATSGTATNAAPSAPTVTLDVGQNELVCRVTSAAAADFAAYEYVWKKDGSAVLTQESSGFEQQYAAQSGDEGAHSWTCTVRQRDLFGQYSTATVSSTVTMDALTIAYLRSGLLFSDSVGTSVSTLAVLKDNNLASGGISYAA